MLLEVHYFDNLLFEGEENRRVVSSDLRFSKNPSDAVNNALPVSTLPPPASPEATDSQTYNTPEPVDSLHLKTSNDMLMYQSPGGVKAVRGSADSNQYATYSSIDDEDSNVEDSNLPSNVKAKEYENPDDLRRGGIAVHIYETVDDLK